MSKLIPESIREEYSYCPETGAITKIKYVPKSILKVGDIAKSVTRNGKYFKLGHKGKEYLQHRVAWFLHYNEQPPRMIDHRDGNGFNNSITNLRAANDSTNQMNIDVTTKSTTGIKGVMPVRGGKLFRAEVCVEGKRYQKHSKDVAFLEQWVQDKRKEMHGEFYK